MLLYIEELYNKFWAAVNRLYKRVTKDDPTGW